MYEEFALVYDRLMRDVDYAAWADYYAGILMENGVGPGKKVAECACGTGSLTIPLQKKGYKMTGLDLSEDMLAAAMTRARQEGVTVPFICQDMTRLALPSRVHAVLATCDGVNYLTRETQVRDFFRAAYAALRPDGVLCFDVSTPEKLQGTLGDHTLFADEDDYAYIWQNEWNEAARCVRLDLTIFTRREDGAFDRTCETQLQRAHSRGELTGWLQDAGFDSVVFYPEAETGFGAGRWHISARKNGG